jgi:hypothetical protein
VTLKLTRVRGKADQYVFTYDNGTKVVAWQVDGNDVGTETLTDVVDTVHPSFPAYDMASPRHNDIRDGIARVAATVQPFQPTLPGMENYGAEAADKAAREEEQRLMNMGGALRTGINMAAEDIPVLDISSSGHVRSDLPDVNWGA